MARYGNTLLCSGTQHGSHVNASCHIRYSSRSRGWGGCSDVSKQKFDEGRYSEGKYKPLGDCESDIVTDASRSSVLGKHLNHELTTTLRCA